MAEKKMTLKTILDITLSTLKYKFFGIRAPIVLSISITSRCNLKCVYCYSEADNRHAHDVPFAEIKDILDRFYALGTRIVLLQGGEPLLHKDLDAIITYVKSKGIYCAVTTNALNFRDRLDSLKKVDQVQLSIDGDERITDNNRGQGVYAALVGAMKLCNENNIPFHLHTVITRETSLENTLLPLTELANKYHSYLNFCIPVRTGSAKDKNLADFHKIRDFYKLVLEKKRQGLPTNNSYQGLLDIISWGDNHAYDAFVPSGSPEIKKYKKCVMGDLVCWLDSEGKLYPCAFQLGQGNFNFSVKELGVRGAWEKLKALPCHYCACSTEFNNLFNFRFGSVLNSLKFLLHRQKNNR